MIEIHRCENMNSAEAWIEYAQGEYLLNLNRVASEKDLEENNHLDEVGQTIDHVSINIKYCPYCGESFVPDGSGFTPSFVYNDLSKW